MARYIEVVRPHLRTFPDPMHEWHKELYVTTAALVDQLEDLFNRPIIDNDFIRRTGLRIFLDRLVVDEEQTNGNGHSRHPRFFDPGDPQVAARRAQRWNASNRWPQQDPTRPEIINYLRHFPIRMNIPLFDDLEHNFRRCCEMLRYRDVEQEEIRQEEIRQEPQEEEEGLGLRGVPEYRAPEYRAPESHWVRFE